MRQALALKIGVSGVRGIVGDALTPQLVTTFGAAFGTYAGAGPILVGTDTRPSRDMVRHAVMAGLMSVGCIPVDLGIVPVPVLQSHIRRSGAFGGICVTASHNPIEWNALKFFGADGILLRPHEAAELTDLYHQGVFPRIGGTAVAEPRHDDSAIARHREAVLRHIDMDAIRSAGIHVAVDCCNGAAHAATPAFLEQLGCRVTAIYVDPDEPFPHNPEPVPENMTALGQAVLESGADIGFIQDADADRLAIADETGVPLGEESTLAIVVRHVLKRDPGPVVVNVSTSRMLDDICREAGCPLHRTRVGEINVVSRMAEVGARIGGEGNGGVIAPAINPCRDSFVAMAYVLEAMAQEAKSISALRAAIPHYAFIKERIEVSPREVPELLRALRALWGEADLDYTDGIKAIWADRWIQARASNTEPIVRLIAEAPCEADARQMLDAARAVLSRG
ncbi:MAG: phosphoglucosamine mutase [Chthonomonadales bacterium]|nr:phosphoglucosamine mutase [Chthonomonadales bacterium]